MSHPIWEHDPRRTVNDAYNLLDGRLTWLMGELQIGGPLDYDAEGATGEVPGTDLEYTVGALMDTNPYRTTQLTGRISPHVAAPLLSRVAYVVPEARIESPKSLTVHNNQSHIPRRVLTRDGDFVAVKYPIVNYRDGTAVQHVSVMRGSDRLDVIDDNARYNFISAASAIDTGIGLVRDLAAKAIGPNTAGV